MGILCRDIVGSMHLTDLTTSIQSTEETDTGRLSWLAVLEAGAVLPREKAHFHISGNYINLFKRNLFLKSPHR